MTSKVKFAIVPNMAVVVVFVRYMSLIPCWIVPALLSIWPTTNSVWLPSNRPGVGLRYVPSVTVSS